MELGFPWSEALFLNALGMMVTVLFFFFYWQSRNRLHLLFLLLSLGKCLQLYKVGGFSFPKAAMSTC